MLRPSLTVVIPHFNHGAIVPRAVASVLQNKITDVEIIIVDDGSTDGSKVVLDALALAHPAVQVCKIACNIDPLRGLFASNSDPL